MCYRLQPTWTATTACAASLPVEYDVALPFQADGYLQIKTFKDLNIRLLCQNVNLNDCYTLSCLLLLLDAIRMALDAI